MGLEKIVDSVKASRYVVFCWEWFTQEVPSCTPSIRWGFIEDGSGTADFGQDVFRFGGPGKATIGVVAGVAGVGRRIAARCAADRATTEQNREHLLVEVDDRAGHESGAF